MRLVGRYSGLEKSARPLCGMVRDCLPDPPAKSTQFPEGIWLAAMPGYTNQRARFVEWSATACQSPVKSTQFPEGIWLAAMPGYTNQRARFVPRLLARAPVKSTQFPEGIWLAAMPGYTNQRARVLWNGPRLLTRANPISSRHLVGSYAGLHKSARPLCGMVRDCLPEPR